MVSTQPCILKVIKAEIQFDRYLLANSQFLESSTVHFPCFLSFLLAVASNNAFIINLAKMGPGSGVETTYFSAW